MMMMMMMKNFGMTLQALTLLLVIALLWNHAAASNAEAQDCCLSTSDYEIPRRIVVEYQKQTVESGCKIPATVFVTKKGRRLCAPVPEKSEWVAKLIKKLKKNVRRRRQNGKRQ
ncbi:C-C motif chemokine 19b [Chanos chanos]|uniref:C-C motif chemokine 19b n=1 Tax=Chanos chanos TaxID=29144 RepID=A0A6J2UY81_CHACN|nr:C-C motif chemokine 19-like [Chanos chanos]